MPLKVAEQLRAIAIRCAQLAKTCTDKPAAQELEGISVEIAEQAKALEDHFK